MMKTELELENQRLKDYNLYLKSSNEYLKSDYSDYKKLLCAILLTLDGTIKIYDKALAISPNLSFKITRDEDNRCIHMELIHAKDS